MRACTFLLAVPFWAVLGRCGCVKLNKVQLQYSIIKDRNEERFLGIIVHMDHHHQLTWTSLGLLPPIIASLCSRWHI